MGILAGFSRAALRGGLDCAGPLPHGAIATLMHLLQLVSNDVCVRWVTIAEGDKFRMSMAAEWWRSTSERSVDPGFHIHSERELPTSMPLEMLWRPALHPNARRYTLAQDRVYRRGYPESFPSIKKAKQYTAQRVLNEMAEGNHYQVLWNNTWLTCLKYGHQVVRCKHLARDPANGHISLLSRTDTVARQDYALLFTDQDIHLCISVEENLLTRLTEPTWKANSEGMQPREPNGVGRCMHCGATVCELTIRNVKTTTGRRRDHPCLEPFPPERSVSVPKETPRTSSVGKRMAL